MCLHSLVELELELETLEESLPGDGVSVLGGSLCPSSPSARPPVPSSQPFRLLKVILALRMWYSGISEWEEREAISSPRELFSTVYLNHPICLHLFPSHPPSVSSPFPRSPILTGKPGGKRRVMKSRSLANRALEMAMRSMIGTTCSARDRG